MSLNWMAIRAKWEDVFHQYHIPLTGGQVYVMAAKCRSLTESGCSEYVALHRVIADLKLQYDLSDEIVFDLYAAIDAVKLDEAHRERFQDICDNDNGEDMEEPMDIDDTWDDDRMWRYF